MSLLVDGRDDRVLHLRLDRPDRRNALDLALVESLLAELSDVTARAVVLGSSDDRWFCAGADLTISDAERTRVSDRLYELYEQMIDLPVPIVVAVSGPAIGGGAQLALASDLRVVGPTARFRFAGAGHGLAVGSWALPSLVGRGRALDLCMTTRDVSADEAIGLGLADRVAGDPEAAAVELARSFADLDAGAVARIKSIVAETCGLRIALRRERDENFATWSGAAPPLRRP